MRLLRILTSSIAGFMVIALGVIEKGRINNIHYLALYCSLQVATYFVAFSQSGEPALRISGKYLNFKVKSKFRSAGGFTKDKASLVLIFGLVFGVFNFLKKRTERKAGNFAGGESNCR